MNATTRAILLMVFAMAAFAVSDALVKIAAQRLSVALVLLATSAIGGVGFAVMAKRRGLPLLSASLFNPNVAVRSMCEIVAAVCLLNALTLSPLIDVIAITQAVPVLVTMGAAVILREPVGPRRWAAVIAGMIGVMIVLNPTGVSSGPGALLAFAAACGLAGRDIYTRAAPSDVHVLQLAAWGMLINVPTGLFMVALSGPVAKPSPVELILLLAISLSIMSGYWAITTSVRMAVVSVVVPFRYLRMPFGVLLGIGIFGEALSLRVALGSAIIVAAGLYILRREHMASFTNHA